MNVKCGRNGEELSVPWVTPYQPSVIKGGQMINTLALHDIAAEEGWRVDYVQ